jgi:hypothetical protein
MLSIEEVESRYAQLSGTFIEKSVLFTVVIALTLEIDNDNAAVIVSMGINNNDDDLSVIIEMVITGFL